MCCKWRDIQHLLNHIFSETFFLQAYSRKRMHHVLRAGTCNHALDFNTHQAPGMILCSDGLCNQAINLLRWTSRDRCPSLERIGRADMDFCPERFLLLNNGFSYMLGK